MPLPPLVSLTKRKLANLKHFQKSNNPLERDLNFDRRSVTFNFNTPIWHQKNTQGWSEKSLNLTQDREWQWVCVCVWERERERERRERKRERETGCPGCALALVCLFPFFILVFSSLLIPLSNLLVYSSSLLETNHSSWSRENERERKREGRAVPKNFLISKSERSFWSFLHLCFFFLESYHSLIIPGLQCRDQSPILHLPFQCSSTVPLFFLFPTILRLCSWQGFSLRPLTCFLVFCSFNKIAEREGGGGWDMYTRILVWASTPVPVANEPRRDQDRDLRSRWHSMLEKLKFAIEIVDSWSVAWRRLQQITRPLGVFRRQCGEGDGRLHAGGERNSFKNETDQLCQSNGKKTNKVYRQTVQINGPGKIQTKYPRLTAFVLAALVVRASHHQPRRHFDLVTFHSREYSSPFSRSCSWSVISGIRRLYCLGVSTHPVSALWNWLSDTNRCILMKCDQWCHTVNFSDPKLYRQGVQVSWAIWSIVICCDMWHRRWSSVHKIRKTSHFLNLSQFHMIWKNSNASLPLVIGCYHGVCLQIAGIILDNYCRGRRRHIWFSISTDLRMDAER